jgi:hypothetical protein
MMWTGPVGVGLLVLSSFTGSRLAVLSAMSVLAAGWLTAPVAVFLSDVESRKWRWIWALAALNFGPLGAGAFLLRH